MPGLDWMSIIPPNRKKYYREIFNDYRSITLLDESRYICICAITEHCLKIEGAYAECGVYKGGSAIGIVKIVKGRTANRRIHLFDSFNGLNQYELRSADFHSLHTFNDYSFQDVARWFPDDDNLHFHVGFIPETLKQVEDERFSFVHLDLNFYESTRESLRFFCTHLSPGGVIIVDDYGFKLYEDHVKRAVDEFCEESGLEMFSLGTGQCLLGDSILEVLG